jgi:hypothetical protein
LIISYGDKKQAVINDQYQQTDIYNGLKNIVSDKLRYSDWRGDAIAGKPPKYTTYRRGDQRDIVSVFSNNKDWSVKLDGDNTRVVNDNSPDQETKDSIKQKINAVRILYSAPKKSSQNFSFN